MKIQLTAAQQCFWFAYKLNPQDVSYNLQFGFIINGNLDSEKLHQAIKAIVTKQPMLRVRFEESTDQQVEMHCNPPTEEVLFKYTVLEHYHESCFDDILYQPYDLSRDPMLRCSVAKLADDKHILCCVLPHIISDAFSLDIFYQDLYHFYHDETDEQVISVTQFQQMQDELIQAEKSSELPAWAMQKTDSPFCLSLPVDYRRPSVRSCEGDNVMLTLSQHDVQALAKTYHVTPYALMLTLYMHVLWLYTQEKTLTVGVPVNLRDNESMEALIGLCINTVPVHLDINPAESFDALLDQVTTALFSAMDCRYTSLDKIADQLQLEKSLAYSSIFQTMFVLRQPQQTLPAKNGLSIEPHIIMSKTAYMDLMLDILPLNDEYVLRWNYNATLFRQETIAEISQQFMRLISDLSRSGEIAREMDASDESLLSYFYKQVEAAPEKIALTYEGRQYSYHTLDEQSNQLAQYFMSHSVAASQVLVCIVDGTEKYVLLVLAALKLGLPFFPINKNQPAARIMRLLTVFDSAIVVTEEVDIDLASPHMCIEVKSLFERAERCGKQAISQKPVNKTAYYMCTSGSTGLPKIVAGTQVATINRFKWMWRKFPFQQNERCCVRSAIGFGDSIWEVLGPLCAGTEIVLVDQICREDPVKLNTFIIENGLTRLIVVPALLKALTYIWETSKTKPSTLQLLTSSGEELTTALALTMKGYLPDCALLNLYGSSEVAADASYYIFDENAARQESFVPIGQPIAHVTIQLLDENKNPVPEGEQGEIYIGGVCLSSGYLNDSAESDKRFVFHCGERLFKTGDIAKRDSDGLLHFCYREKDSVKIRGQKLSLNEVDNNLRAYPGIYQSVTLAVKDKQTDSKQLVSFVVLSASPREVTSDVLQKFMQKNLPDYMCPVQYHFIDELPKNNNGKIDKKRLLSMVNKAGEDKEQFEKPVNTALLQDLISVWRDFFKRDSINVSDDFFRLGGNSLSAVKMMYAINDKFGIELSVVDIFQHPGLAELANHIDQVNPSISTTAVSSSDKPCQLKANYIQKSYWVHQQAYEDDSSFNIGFYAELSESLDVSRFERAMTHVVNASDSFRTYYEFAEDELTCHVEPKIELSDFYKKIDHRHYTKSQAVKLAHLYVNKRFMLDDIPLLRVVLIKLNTGYLFVICSHHIAIDGYSYQLLMKKISAAYECDGDVQTDGHTYQEFTRWQNNLLTTEKAFFSIRALSEAFSSLKPLALPYRMAVAGNQKNQSIRLVQQVDNALFNRIEQYCQRSGMTVFQYTFSVFMLLLCRVTNQDNCYAFVPYLNRSNQTFQDVIGSFANILLIAPKFNKSMCFNDALQEIKRALNTAYSHADIPLMKVLEGLENKNDILKNGIYPATFAFEDVIDLSLNLPGVDYRFGEVVNDFSRFCLSLTFSRRQDHATMAFECSQQYFDQAVLKTFLEVYTHLLATCLDEGGRAISEIDIIPASQQALIRSVSPTNAVEADDVGVYAQFKQAAETYGEKIALQNAVTFLTYDQVEDKVEQLAEILTRQGFESGDCVALFLDNGVDAIQVMLALLKLSICFLPIHVGLPKPKIQYMLDTSQADMLVTSKALQEQLPGTSAVILNTDDLQLSKPRLQKKNNYDDVAYIMFTSGSTGDPNGVMCREDALVNILQAVRARLDINHKTDFISVNNYAFDVCLLEYLLPVMTGATVYVATEKEKVDPLFLQQRCEKAKHVFMQATPTLWNILLAQSCMTYPHLAVASIGEELTATTAAKLLALTDQVYNFYGPTEATVFVTIAAITDSQVTIGSPIDNIEVVVVDADLRPLPTNMPGELLIVGKGVAKGYLKLPANKPNPFIQWRGKPCYRTGDKVSLNDDGELMYWGRQDKQIKFNGVRVEINEIRHSVLLVSCVADAYVLYENDALLCYVKLEQDYDISKDELIKKIQTNLPKFIYFSQIIVVDKFVYNQNGKIDLAALKQNQPSTKQSGLLDIETEIKTIWRECFLLEEPDINTSFYQYGSTSIQAFVLMNKLKKRFAIDIKISDIFDYPTIHLQTQWLLSLKNSKAKPASHAAPRQQSGKLEDIAIIGFSARLPGADNVNAYWESLFEADDNLMHTGIKPRDILGGTFIDRCGIIEGLDYFDADFFQLPNHDACKMNMHHRLMLELVHEALSYAGVASSTYAGRIGLYAGMGWSPMLKNVVENKGLNNDDYNEYVSHACEFVTAYPAYKFNFTGPVGTINTACSSSLVSTSMAINSLQLNQADIMLAGGVSLFMSQQRGYWYMPGHVFSNDGICRPFDKDRTGMVPSSGGGLVVLKRLSDAVKEGDTIYAVIKGRSVTNDGANKATMLAPNKKSQVICYQQALTNAKVQPESVAYIETHGTGTLIGDQIELESLAEVYARANTKMNCTLGSVKANIGHVDTASGVAGLIKTSLSIYHNLIPPLLHYNESEFDWLKAKGLSLSNKASFCDFTQQKTHAAVSSFGMSGTNAHVILSSAEAVL